MGGGLFSLWRPSGPPSEAQYWPACHACPTDVKPSFPLTPIIYCSSSGAESYIYRTQRSRKIRKYHFVTKKWGTIEIWCPTKAKYNNTPNQVILCSGKLQLGWANEPAYKNNNISLPRPMYLIRCSYNEQLTVNISKMLIPKPYWCSKAILIKCLKTKSI